MIEIKNLSKKYDERFILKDINLKLERGKIYGLFGRNGVGKTTLLKILSNQIVSYKGEISYEGEKITENRKSLEHICYVSSDDNLGYFSKESLRELLKINELLYVNFDFDYAIELLEDFNINPFRKYKELSKGNKVIFNLIVGLSANCDFTIFDEPSSGLDAINRTKFYKIFSEVFDNENKTAIVATHIIDEIENYITDILILKRANIFLNESIEEFEEKSMIITTNNDVELDLNVIGEDNLGSLKICYVYDELSENFKKKLLESGCEISRMDLQKFFIELVEEKREKISGK